MRTVSVPLMVCVVVASLLLGGVSWGDSFVLSGDFLRVGVNNSGGLIDGAFTHGIQFDPAGTGTFGAEDFIKPGSPLEWYGMGTGGSSRVAGYNYGNNFFASTTNTSASGILAAHSSGSFGSLGFTQDLHFGSSDHTVYFDVTLTNNGGASLTDVVYDRGLDPDQDSYTFGTNATLNSIPNSSTVVATGPVSGHWIAIQDYSGFGVPSVTGWEEDPYASDLRLGNANLIGLGDNTISMDWSLGDLAPGSSRTMRFGYELGPTTAGPTPELPPIALLSALPLGIAWLRRRRAA